MTKACFIDRDGVLIVEKNYLKEIADIELEEGAEEAIKLLRRHGFKVIVVSNQAGVARGYFTESTVRTVNGHIDALLKASGAVIDGWYYCPHHPKGTVAEFAVQCRCRKPEPGMLFQAADDFQLDLGASYMIGDKGSDIEAAERSGCKAGILVTTGHGKEIEPENLKTFKYVAGNILDAVKMIVNLE